MKWRQLLIVFSLGFISVNTQAVILPEASHISAPDSFGYFYIDSLHGNGPAYNFIDITGTEDQLWNVNWDNYWGNGSNTIDISIGFDFPFYGADYSHAYFSNNGFLSLDQAYAGSTYDGKGSMGTGAGYGAMIAPFWSIGDNPDLEVRVKTFGTAPDRYTIIQVDNWRSYYGDTDTSSYQVQLYENGLIEIHYRQLDRSANRAYTAYYQRNIWGIQNQGENTGLTYFDGTLDNGNDLGSGDLPTWFTDEVAANGMAIRYVPSLVSASLDNIVSSEQLSVAEFDIVLLAQPTSDVSVQLSIADTSEGQFQQSSSYVFTNANWNIPQTVQIQGLDDDLPDGDITYTISGDMSSDDEIFNGSLSVLTTVTNKDDETTDFDGFTVDTSNTGNTSDAGDSTSFSIRMNQSPGVGETVQLNFSVSDASEATISAGSQIIFTSSNWFYPQTVTITGLDDGISEPNSQYQINYSITTAVADYIGLAIPEIDELIITNLPAYLDFINNLPDDYVLDLNPDEEEESVNKKQPGDVAVAAVHPALLLLWAGLCFFRKRAFH